MFSRCVGDNDTDEEINPWRCRPDRTREKMQSEWIKMKDLLSQLQKVSMSLTVSFHNMFSLYIYS